MSLAAYLAQRGLTDGDFAAQVGVSDELVRLWRHGLRTITAKRAVEISEITGIPRHELRPDLWEPPPPKRRKRPRPPPTSTDPAKAAAD